jgi:hypothetical protein
VADHGGVLCEIALSSDHNVAGSLLLANQVSVELHEVIDGFEGQRVADISLLHATHFRLHHLAASKSLQPEWYGGVHSCVSTPFLFGDLHGVRSRRAMGLLPLSHLVFELPFRDCSVALQHVVVDQPPAKAMHVLDDVEDVVAVMGVGQASFHGWFEGPCTIRTDNNILVI